MRASIVRRFLRRSLAWVLLSGSGWAGDLLAQDVEVLWSLHGHRPPAGYFEEQSRDSDAFRFGREGRQRLQGIRDSALRRPGGTDGAGASLLMLGPRDAPVAGEFRLPLVLGLFSDGPEEGPLSYDVVQAEYFDGPSSHFQTVSEFYAEMSGGLVQLEGTTFDWVQTDLTRQQVTRGGSGLVRHSTEGVGAFIEAILVELDATGVDWSQFDNTGDGFVDVLTVIHPYRGAECTGATDLIGSHRWRLSSVTDGRLAQGFETSTPRSDGQGNIRINDYTVQPLLSCASDPGDEAPQVNLIGTYAHELGHAFGLPDLYHTGGGVLYAGAGYWDLMGMGNWGCRAGLQSHPCHMGAWSKKMLGWLEVLEVEDLLPEGHGLITLEPVQHTNRVLKVPARDGSREYLLLENRQRVGSDLYLFEPGLLVWHIDEDIVELNWSANAVNNDPSRMGVWLRQADGRNQLARTLQEGGNRGDRGDPFPGCVVASGANPFDPEAPCESSSTAFHLGTNPAALSHQGRGLGVVLREIQLAGEGVQDVSFHLDTRFTWDSIGLTETVEAAREEEIHFSVDGGVGPDLVWRLVDGSLPTGFSFDEAEARLWGTTLETGNFEFGLSVADGATREVHVRITLQVQSPIIAQEELVATFLDPQADPLPEALRLFLDFQGNHNGAYDLGDLRAYLQSVSDVPPSAPPPTRIREVRVPFWGPDPAGRNSPR